MGEVVHIVSQEAAESAWAAYQEQAQRLVDDRRLATDRDFMEEFWRRERLAKRLFGRLDG